MDEIKFIDNMCACKHVNVCACIVRYCVRFKEYSFWDFFKKNINYEDFSFLF